MQRNQPNSSAPDDTGLQRQVRTILETQIARYPILVQLRAIWAQLQDERAAWPLLLPLLAVVFIGTYRNERRRQREDARRASGKARH